MLNPSPHQSPFERGRAGQTPKPRHRRAAASVATRFAVALLVGASSLDSVRATPPAALAGFAGRTPSDLQSAVEKLVADGEPGVIVMTRRGNDISHVTAGVADQASGQPMQPQDRAHIGSITKTLVATAILQLVAERRLSLDDSVQRWLPGVIAGHGYHPDRITIRDLLQHTSGLRDYPNAPGFLTPQFMARTWQPRQLVDIALRLGPRCMAGCTRTPTTSCSACSSEG